jgi:hypothetical protein
MKVYQLKGLEIYVVAFSKADAMMLCLYDRIGVTTDDIMETDIIVDREAIGQVFRSYESLSKYID